VEKIRIPFTPTAKKTYQALRAGYPVIVNEGSARSGKTYGEIQIAILKARDENKGVSIVSHSLPHIKRGAYRDFRDIMERMGIWDEQRFSYTDFVYEFHGGGYIELFGLEDETRARGPKRDILIINEGNLIKKTVYDQLAIRTTEQIIIDLNPADLECWCYGEADNPVNKKIHSTYLDNKTFINGKWISNLNPIQIRRIEAYKDADPFMWNVFGLGLRGHATDIIYTHWKICDALPMKGELFFGQDFGYNVPSALILCELYEGAVYIDEWIYETKLTTNDLIERYKELGVSKTIEIFCDSAEPKTIEELYRAGYNAKESIKDVTEGIRKVKSFPLYITERSENTIKEVKGYKWRTDKNGKPVKDHERDEPVKLNDHAMDASRYAIFTKTHEPSYSWVGF
jgi:phage terminase large subunit